MNNKLVSIIMSVYNENIHELSESIDSIINQTYKNIEIIIVNDNPQNKMIAKVLTSYRNRDKRIIIIKNKKNIGLALSLNKAIKLSVGDYIARIDADDIMIENRIEKQMDFFYENQDISIVGSNAIIINEKGENTGYLRVEEDSNKIKIKMKYLNCLIHPSVLMKKKVLERVGYYRNFPCAQDYDLFSRVLTCGYKIANIREPLIKYRIRSNGVSISKGLKQFLVAEYIKKLQKERIKKGRDSFSKEYLEEIIKLSLEEEEKYKKGKLIVINSSSNKLFKFYSYLKATTYSRYFLLELKEKLIARIVLKLN